MKKRIVCVLLTLIMLMSLVPVTASAAGMSVSESAITILKQLEGYTTTCNSNGYTGYGTLCTEKGTHGGHKTNEKLADAALREALKTLDEAVNSFATSNGLALTQGKHDALVLFSFQNGTAWTTGTGDFKAAVISGKTGTDFLNAICRWSNADDDNRRMIEANMYLNGVYSSSRPSSFIRVNYYPNYMRYELPLDGQIELHFGDISENTTYQYYDVSSTTVPHLTPSMDYHTFTGWYTWTEYGWTKVTTLNASSHGDYLVAQWVPNYSAPGDTAVDFIVTASQLASLYVYKYNSTKSQFEVVALKNVGHYYFMENSLRVDSDYLDEAGIRWCRIAGTEYWVMMNGYGSVVTGSAATAYIDVTVTVTNSYVRSRVNASIHSAQNGSYSKGDQLRIINTADADGFLWGQVAQSATDNTPIGWVALMYTNWESVRNSGASTVVNNTNAVATAVVTYNGYVNVRSDAGTNNKIVGALPYGTEVSLYETKFVNGLEWGRCSTGWFCLSYASVTKLTTDTSYTTDTGFASYVFTGTVDPSAVEIYKEPSLNADRIFTRQYIEPSVTVSNFVSADGITWGKIKEGWIRVTDNATYQPIDVNLNAAKFYVTAESVSVRENPYTAASRIDSLVKGVEFNVNEQNQGKNYQIVVVGDTIWGYATKVGENTKTYAGWVNLANANVSRNGAPTVSTDSSSNISTGLMGTVINTDNLKVRNTGATYGTQIGTLSRGSTVAVWEENDGWYKVDSNKNGTYDYEGDGWVSGSYLSVYEGTADSSSSSGTTSSGSTGTTETGMGVVANTYSGVNVRQGAGTGYAAVGKLLPGTAVEILEVTTAGASKWGRTTQGWVCMDYITMISNYEIAGSATTGTAGTAGNTTGSTTTAETAIYTGTAKGVITIYKETSQNSDAVRTLNAGDPVTMHEILTVTEEVTSDTTTNDQGSTTTTVKKTSYWARVNDGYIYAPGDNINLDTVDEHTYTVTGTEKLNVRSGAGTGNAAVDKLMKGDQVTVTELQIVNGSVWGKVEYEDEEGGLCTGWASLAYMSKGAITIVDESQNNTTNNNNTNTNTGTVTPPVVMGNGSSVGGFVTNTSGYRYTGKVIRTNTLNVRATPSQTASKTTTLSSGQAMVIYETTIAENMAWGRCDAGWVYLYYVDLVPVTGAVDARVVYNENTVIYTDMNCSGVAGTYTRMAVVDIYEIVGKMARTEQGWVNTDNLL